MNFENFFVRWIVYACGSGIICFIITTFKKICDKVYEKRSLDRRHIRFAFLHKAINELDVFLINDRKEHTNNAGKYLEEYFSRNFLNYTLKGVEKQPNIKLPELLMDIRKNNSWIIYNEETIESLTAFQSLDKIYERINQRIEIDKIIDILNDLQIYEYVLIDKSKIGADQLTQDYLNVAARKINSLEAIEKLSPENGKKNTVDKLNDLSKSFSGIFIHKNIVILFISWFALISLIFISLLYLGVKIYGLKIDSTLYIGAISGIFLGTITLTAAIFSSRK